MKSKVKKTTEGRRTLNPVTRRTMTVEDPQRSAGRVIFRSSAHNSVLNKMSFFIADTPRTLGKGMVSKSSRKEKSIKISPHSGAMMTLCHKRITKRLGLMEGVQFELFDAYGRKMEVKSTCAMQLYMS